MFAAITVFEVMDKEPPLWLFPLYSLSMGATGMLLARRRPILCSPFIALVLVGVFALYLELRDTFVGEAILREGGFAYIASCGFAILAGIGMPLFSAFAKGEDFKSMAAWRWTLGASGAVILGLTLFVASGFVEAAYYAYIFYPREKAGEGYIMPLRWQDIVAELSIACVLIGLLLLSIYLMRCALRPKVAETLKSSANG